MSSIEKVKAERASNLRSIQTDRELVHKYRKDRYKEQRDQERKSLQRRFQARDEQERISLENAKSRLTSELVQKVCHSYS